MIKKFKKGEYEKAVEKAKDMMNRGIGSLEIMSETGLDEGHISKIQTKKYQKEND
ncbi:hypothetical protein [Hathewaya massiliensis]|uniref:hypothetical protein n=1 Tax=Hathewaya massiliensis TaxID=1964382 RepID=UPI00163C51E2|nr:hypothetical protein [Hathewaya massiliensis]